MTMLRSLLASVLIASAASAQPTAPTALAPPIVPMSDSAHGVSSTGAVLASLAATGAAVGVGALLADSNSDLATGVIIAGLAVGPSLGNVLQGETRDALIGVGFRVVGGGLFALGANSAFNYGPSSNLEQAGIAVAILGGTAMVLTGTVYDLVTAGTNARRSHFLPGYDVASGTTVAVLRVGL